MKHGNANATTGGAQECLFWVTHNKGDVGTLKAETNDKRGIGTAIRRMEERMFTTCISSRYRYAGGSSPNSGQRYAYSTRKGTRRSVRVVSSASRYRVNGLRIYLDPVLEPEVPEPVVPLPVLLPEPVVPEPLLPEPIVPVSEPVVPVPEPVVPEPLLPEPIVPVPEPVPEPVVPVSVPLEPVPGRLLVPEPLIPELPLPEPLLPEPEVWASTKGAVTTSTARAATAILLNLLNISLCSYNLEGCTLLVALFEPYSPALHSAWEPCPGGKGAILMPEAHAGDSAPSAVPSCGIARSYFESRRRRHSCKNIVSKFLSKRKYAVLAKVGKKDFARVSH
jgi:hypothetical protein